MHILSIAYFGLIAACALCGVILCGLGLRQLPWLKNTNPARSKNSPSISIIFAARDEAEKLPAALPTLLNQDYEDYEVVAVNDRSRDATGDILNQFASASKLADASRLSGASDFADASELSGASKLSGASEFADAKKSAGARKLLRVLQVTELPSGWLGKTHALDAGYRASRGEWLVFTDADVRFAPDVLSRAMALAEERKWDHLTLLAGIDAEGFWEITAISYFGLVFVCGNGIWHVNRERSGAYNGVGAFQMVRREAYERSGGHVRLAMEVIDDMKLGKIVKLAGFRSGTGVAFDEVRVRWQAGLRNIILGVTKNMFAACGYNAAFAGLAMLMPIVFSIVPLLGVIFAHGWARIFAGVALVAVMSMHASVLIGAGLSPIYALTNPIGAALMSWMILRSTFVTLRDGGVRWRDTFYSLDELRKGMV